ncbi:hypothetical protein MRY87_11645 [bacterium]|nr:hypothetical protein [bacterium]
MARKLVGEVFSAANLPENFIDRFVDCEQQFLDQIATEGCRRFGEEDKRGVKCGMPGEENQRTERLRLGVQAAALLYNPEEGRSLKEFLRKGYFLAEWATVEELREVVTAIEGYEGEELPGMGRFQRVLAIAGKEIAPQNEQAVQEVITRVFLEGLLPKSAATVHQVKERDACFWAHQFQENFREYLEKARELPAAAAPAGTELHQETFPAVPGKPIHTERLERVEAANEAIRDLTHRANLVLERLDKPAEPVELDRTPCEEAIKSALFELLKNEELPTYDRARVFEIGERLLESDPALGEEDAAPAISYLLGVSRELPDHLQSRWWAQAKSRYLSALENGEIDPEASQEELGTQNQDEVLRYGISSYTPFDIELRLHLQACLQSALSSQ